MIDETLASYSAACDRASIDRRPLVWANHFDIWRQPLGDLGLNDRDELATAAFAVMIPFVVVPEIATSVLVVDLSELVTRELALIQFSVNAGGTLTEHWQTRFGINDDGTLVFDSPRFGLPSHVTPPSLLASLSVVTDARRDRVGWSDCWTFNSSTKVVDEFLRRLTV